MYAIVARIFVQYCKYKPNQLTFPKLCIACMLEKVPGNHEYYLFIAWHQQDLATPLSRSVLVPFTTSSYELSLVLALSENEEVSRDPAKYVGEREHLQPTVVHVMRRGGDQSVLVHLHI